MEKVLLATAENCVNTTVFARCWPQNTVNTVVFATRSKKHRKYRGFGLARRKTHSIYGVFCSETLQKTRKHHLFDHFFCFKTATTTTAAAATTV